jgi:hypothetical protein
MPIYGEKEILMGRPARTTTTLVHAGYTILPADKTQFRIDCDKIPESVTLRRLISFYHSNKAQIDAIPDPAGYP